MSSPAAPAAQVLVDALTLAAMQEDPHIHDVLVVLLKVLDSQVVWDGLVERPASSAELEQAASLLEAMSFHLVKGDNGRSAWSVSPFAQSLEPKFGVPQSLDSVTDEAVAVWRNYAMTDLPPFVVAHLADLVATKGVALPGSAEVAIDALRDLRGVVPDVYAADHLARALELALQFNLAQARTTVEDDLLDHAARSLEGDGQLGTFARSIEPLASRHLRTDPVTDLLDRATRTWAGNSLSLETVHQLRRKAALNEESRDAAERDHVLDLLSEAELERNGIRRLALLHRAHDVATTYGHADLAARAQNAMREIPVDSFGLQAIEIDLPFPEGFVESRIAAIVGRDGLSAALERLVAYCPTGDDVDVRARALAGEGTGTLSSLFDTTVLNADFLPKGAHAGDDIDAAVGRLRDIELGLSLPILAEALDRVQVSYDVSDPRLVEWLTTAHVSATMAEKLVRCLRRYWRLDFEGAAYVGCTLVEGLLRQRVLAAGLDPYDLPTAGARSGRYKTLGHLITLAQRAGEDSSWMAYLSHTLADPAVGLNLRNEFLHGAIDEVPTGSAAAAVLIAALYLTFAPVPLPDAAP